VSWFNIHYNVALCVMVTTLWYCCSSLYKNLLEGVTQNHTSSNNNTVLFLYFEYLCQFVTEILLTNMLQLCFMLNSLDYICVLVKHDWLKWSHDKYNRQNNKDLGVTPSISGWSLICRALQHHNLAAYWARELFKPFNPLIPTPATFLTKFATL